MRFEEIDPITATKLRLADQDMKNKVTLQKNCPMCFKCQKIVKDCFIVRTRFKQCWQMFVQVDWFLIVAESRKSIETRKIMTTKQLMLQTVC